MPNERFQFTGSEGQQLAASLDLPEGEPIACALFAHCFTCGKDGAGGETHRGSIGREGHRGVAARLYRARLQRGRFRQLYVLVQRRRSGACRRHLRDIRKAPAILIGHSLGCGDPGRGSQIPDAKAVVTIATPSDPAHVNGLFADHIDDIRKQGKVEVSLAGRPFQISSEFLDDVAEHNLMEHVAKLHKALLIMHAPTDDTVGIDNATRIFVAAKHTQELCVAGGRGSFA